MKKDKPKKDKELEIQINKKDSTGLFSGKFKPQEFADKKDKLEKISKKEKQKKYQEEDIT